MANAVAIGMDLPQIDAQILRPGANGRRCEDGSTLFRSGWACRSPVLLFNGGRQGRRFDRLRANGLEGRRRFRHRSLFYTRRFGRDVLFEFLFGDHVFDRGFAVGFDHRQRRADRNHVADVTGEFDNDPRHGRFHFDRRLVGHHVGQLGVLLDALADLDVPGNDLGLGDALANVGQAK